METLGKLHLLLTVLARRFRSSVAFAREAETFSKWWHDHGANSSEFLTILLGKFRSSSLMSCIV